MPSTDTRAALPIPADRTDEDLLELYGQLHARLCAHPCAEAVHAAHAAAKDEMLKRLARSAPEERGEGDERLRYGLHQMASGHWQTLYEATNSHHDVSRYVVMQRFAFQLLATPPAPVEGERERAVQMFDEYAELVAGVFRRAVETATAMLRKEGGDALALLKCALAEEIRVANEMEERIRHRLTSHPVQGAGGGEPSRDHIDALLGRLNEIARDCDRFEFGLPLYNEDAREAMIVAVREWAASPAPSAPEEEPQ